MTILATNRLHQLLDSLATTAELVDEAAEGLSLWQTQRARDLLELGQDPTEGHFMVWDACRDSLGGDWNMSGRVENAASPTWREIMRVFYGEGYQVGHVMARVPTAALQWIQYAIAGTWDDVHQAITEGIDVVPWEEGVRHALDLRYEAEELPVSAAARGEWEALIWDLTESNPAAEDFQRRVSALDAAFWDMCSHLGAFAFHEGVLDGHAVGKADSAIE